MAKNPIPFEYNDARMADDLAQWVQKGDVTARPGANPMPLIQKNNPPSNSVSGTQVLQGPQFTNQANAGLFSQPGVRPQRFADVPRPRTLTGLLTPVPTEFYQELVSIMTSVSAGTGTTPTDWLGTPPSTGTLGQITLPYKLGDYTMATNLVPLPMAGNLYNRADIPAVILNSAPQDNPFIPDILWRLTDTRDQTAVEFYKLGIEMERTLEQVLVTGDSTFSGTTRRLGWINEFDGLSKQIRTGYTDMITGTAAAAADSIVINWNTTIGATNASNYTISRYVEEVHWALRVRGQRAGLNPAYAMLMPLELHYVLAQYYALQYNINSLLLSNNLPTAGTPYPSNSPEIKALTNDQINGQFLLLNNMRVPVVYSDGMVKTPAGANQYKSSIFFIPVDPMAGIPLLRYEYKPMDTEYVMKVAQQVNPETIRIINNGMYIMTYNQQNMAFNYQLAHRARLIVETPFLYGRIDNITYTYTASTFDPYPGTSMYAGGGASMYTGFAQ